MDFMKFGRWYNRFKGDGEMIQDMIASGEYLTSWRGLDPWWACEISRAPNMSFDHCTKLYVGMGEIVLWIVKELDKLTIHQQDELERVVKSNEKFVENRREVESALRKYFMVPHDTFNRLSNEEFVQMMEKIRPGELNV